MAQIVRLVDSETGDSISRARASDWLQSVINGTPSADVAALDAAGNRVDPLIEPLSSGLDNWIRNGTASAGASSIMVWLLVAAAVWYFWKKGRR